MVGGHVRTGHVDDAGRETNRASQGVEALDLVLGGEQVSGVCLEYERDVDMARLGGRLRSCLGRVEWEGARDGGGARHGVSALARDHDGLFVLAIGRAVHDLAQLMRPRRRVVPRALVAQRLDEELVKPGDARVSLDRVLRPVLGIGLRFDCRPGQVLNRLIEPLRRVGTL